MSTNRRFSTTPFVVEQRRISSFAELVDVQCLSFRESDEWEISTLPPTKHRASQCEAGRLRLRSCRLSMQIFGPPAPASTGTKSRRQTAAHRRHRFAVSLSATDSGGQVVADAAQLARCQAPAGRAHTQSRCSNLTSSVITLPTVDWCLCSACSSLASCL